MVTIGDRIRSVRRRRGFSRGYVAALCGVSTDTIATVENGDIGLKDFEIESIAAALGIAVKEILEGDVSTMVTIGDRIVKLRRQQGVSQEWLAHMAYLDRHLLSEVENGRAELGDLEIVRVAAAFEITVDELTGDGR